jgi:hypothetical protein
MIDVNYVIDKISINKVNNIIYILINAFCIVCIAYKWDGDF